MSKIGITLVFVFMAFMGWQVFNRSNKNKIRYWIDKTGGLFWMVLGMSGAIMMVIKFFK